MALTRSLFTAAVTLLAACSSPAESTDPLAPPVADTPVVPAPDARFPNAPVPDGWLVPGTIEWTLPVPYRRDPVYEPDNGSRLVDWSGDEPGRDWGRRTALVEDADFPGGRRTVLEARLPAGLGGGFAATKIGQHPDWTGTSALLWGPGQSTGHLYIGLWVRVSPGFRLNGNVAQKVIYLKSDLPQNRHLAHMPIILHGDGVGGDQLWPAYEPQHPFGRYQVPATDANNLNDGRWHLLEVLQRPNAPGRNDGTLQLWIDGRLAGDWRDVMFFEQGQVPSVNRLELNPIYGGGRNPVPQDQWIRYGPMRVLTR